MIEKAPFGDDAEAIEQQIVKHGKYHSSLQQSIEVDRARNELVSLVSYDSDHRDHKDHKYELKIVKVCLNLP